MFTVILVYRLVSIGVLSSIFCCLYKGYHGQITPLSSSLLSVRDLVNLKLFHPNGRCRLELATGHFCELEDEMVSAELTFMVLFYMTEINLHEKKIKLRATND